MEDQKYIQGGLMSSVSSVIKQISNSFLNFIDKLIGNGMQILQQEKTKNGGIRLVVKINGKVAEIVTERCDKKPDCFDIRIKPKDGEAIELKEVNKKDIETKIKAALEAKYGKNVVEMLHTPVKSAKMMQIELKKVMSSSNDITIELTAIHANYHPDSVMKDIDTILDNDAFLNHISETPSSFQIVDDGEDYDISSIDAVDITDTLPAMLGAAMWLYSNMFTLKWTLYGDESSTVRKRLSTYIDKIVSDMNWLGELCVELNGTAPNPLNVVPEYGHITSDRTESGMSFEMAQAYASDWIMTYASTLDMYYPNFPHEIQMELDKMIRYWRKEARYYIAQDLIHDSCVSGTGMGDL